MSRQTGVVVMTLDDPRNNGGSTTLAPTFIPWNTPCKSRARKSGWGSLRQEVYILHVEL